MKILKYFCFTIFLIILFFVALELVLRVTNTGNPEVSPEDTPGFNDNPYFVTDKQNPDLVTTNPQYSNHLHPVKFSKSPEPEEFRIFMYGGSNVYYLKESLFENFFNDDKELAGFGTFKFINLGVTGFGSRRIKNIFDQSIVYKPSMIFIYMGNNEFLDFLLKSSFLENQKQLPFIRSTLSKTNTYNFLKSQWRNIINPGLSLSQKEIKERIFDTPNQIYDNKIAGFNETRNLIYTMYKENLIYILEKAKQNHIKVILITVPSNETVPVFYPYYPETLTGKQLESIKNLENQADEQIHDLIPFLKVSPSQYTFDHILLKFEKDKKLFKDLESYRDIFIESMKISDLSLNPIKPVMITNQRKNQLDISKDLYIQALKISNDVPQIHYKLGLAYYLLKDYPRAREQFRESMKLDATPLRSTPTINTIIREVAAKENVDLLEFEEPLCQRGYHGICDWSLFIDYVHLNNNSKNILMTMFKEKFKKLYNKGND